MDEYNSCVKSHTAQHRNKGKQPFPGLRHLQLKICYMSNRQAPSMSAAVPVHTPLFRRQSPARRGWRDQRSSEEKEEEEEEEEVSHINH